MTENDPSFPSPWFRPAASHPRRIDAALEEEPIRAARPGERRLGRFLLPPFQRPPVWTDGQRVALIESIWDGFPIPAYVVNEPCGADHPCADWLLDGQQRWTAILDYVGDVFPVRGRVFSELPLVRQRDFRGTTLPEVVVRLETPELCYRAYRRLARGGTPHDDLPESWDAVVPEPGGGASRPGGGRR